MGIMNLRVALWGLVLSCLIFHSVTVIRFSAAPEYDIYAGCEVSREQYLLMDPMQARDMLLSLHYDVCELPEATSITSQSDKLRLHDELGSDQVESRGQDVEYLEDVYLRNNLVDQRQELGRLFNETKGQNWVRKTSWNTTRPICEWFGITCDKKCRPSLIESNKCPVLSIQLPENGLQGTLPDISMPYLGVLHLYSNNLEGTLPDFGNLPNLQELWVYDNFLNGTIPDFSNMKNLQELRGNRNQFHGTLPDFTGLQNLKVLWLFDNQLDGSIPNFKSMMMLEYLYLAGNRLSGQLPDFGNVVTLKYIFLSSNDINGSLPDFGNSTNLIVIDLTSNKISGAIPEFRKLKSLRFLVLPSNYLNGTIPDFRGPVQLEEVWLYSNQLNGTVPGFDQLPKLKLIHFGNNQLGGVIPDYKNLPTFGYCDLGSNQLIGQVPDFASCPKVSTIILSENQLSGTLPVLKLPELVIVDLRSNHISGTIPFGFGSTGIEFIDISNNQLNGSIPKSFESMQELKFILLSNNSLEGMMPVKFWNLGNLFFIDFSHNKFTGNIRDFLTPNSDNYEYQYRYLNLQANKLSGSLEWWIFHVIHLAHDVNLKSNLLTGLGELPTNRLWKRLDISNNPIHTAIPESFTYFSQMEYLGLRNTSANHLHNSLIPTFTQTAEPYNLRDRFDLFMCPTIQAVNMTAQTEVDLDGEYYDRVFCQCLPNYFGFAGRCVSCPNECDCKDGLSLKKCHASPSVSSIEMVIPCPQTSSCEMQIPSIDSHATEVPFVEQLCQVGYTGRACSRCEVGYGRQGRGCVACGDSAAETSIIVGILSILAFIVYMYKWSSTTSAKFRIMIFHVQTLSIMSSVWTASRGMDRFIEWSFTLGSMQLPNLDCVLGSTSLFDSALFSILRIPIVLIIGAFLYLIVKSRRDKVVYVTLNVLLLYSYNISKDVFGIFGCTVYDDGDGAWYLNVAPWIKCDPISVEMELLLAMAIPTFILYVVGLPLALFYVVMKRKPNDTSNTEKIGFLYKAYKEECWFWELVVMFRRLMFSFATSVLPYTKPGIIYLMLVVVIQASIWLQHRMRPYNGDMDNRLETLSLYVIFVTFIIALLANMFGSELWMMVLIVGINAMVLSYFTIVGFASIWERYKTTTRQVNRMEIGTNLTMMREATSVVS